MVLGWWVVVVKGGGGARWWRWRQRYEGNACAAGTSSKLACMMVGSTEPPVPASSDEFLRTNDAVDCVCPCPATSCLSATKAPKAPFIHIARFSKPSPSSGAGLLLAGGAASCTTCLPSTEGMLSTFSVSSCVGGLEPLKYDEILLAPGDMVAPKRMIEMQTKRARLEPIWLRDPVFPFHPAPTLPPTCRWPRESRHGGTSSMRQVRTPQTHGKL